MKKTITGIIQAAHDHLPVFLEKHKDIPDMQNRTGGYLNCIFVFLEELKGFSTDEGGGALIGTLPEEKLFEKMMFASEKIMRLLRRLILGYKEETSLFTQNYQTKEFGGGVCIKLANGGYCIISISGFPPFYDTLFVLEVLMIKRVICEEDFDRVMREAHEHQHTGEEGKVIVYLLKGGTSDPFSFIDKISYKLIISIKQIK